MSGWMESWRPATLTRVSCATRGLTQTSILYAGTSRLCSALPVLHAATDCLLRDVDDGEGLLLSPLPFRSLEFNKKDDAGCLDGRRVGVLRR